MGTKYFSYFELIDPIIIQNIFILQTNIFITEEINFTKNKLSKQINWEPYFKKERKNNIHLIKRVT